MEKTNIKGILYDTKTKRFAVATTFTTLDKKRVRKCKRGFSTIEEAIAWKDNESNYYKNIYYSDINSKHRSSIDILISKYLDYRSVRIKPTTLHQIELKLNA